MARPKTIRGAGWLPPIILAGALIGAALQFAPVSCSLPYVRVGEYRLVIEKAALWQVGMVPVTAEVWTGKGKPTYKELGCVVGLGPVQASIVYP
jgi:hypothetical protein